MGINGVKRVKARARGGALAPLEGGRPNAGGFIRRMDGGRRLRLGNRRARAQTIRRQHDSRLKGLEFKTLLKLGGANGHHRAGAVREDRAQTVVGGSG